MCFHDSRADQLADIRDALPGAEPLQAAWKENFPGLPLTKIGWLSPEKESMEETLLGGGGWDHFRVSVAT